MHNMSASVFTAPALRERFSATVTISSIRNYTQDVRVRQVILPTDSLLEVVKAKLGAAVDAAVK